MISIDFLNFLSSRNFLQSILARKQMVISSFPSTQVRATTTSPDKPVVPPDLTSGKQSPEHGGGFGGLESS